MEDEGVVLGTALGLKDPAHGLGIQSVGPQAVDRLRRDAQQAAVPEDGGGYCNILFGQKLRFHLNVSAPWL